MNKYLELPVKFIGEEEMKKMEELENLDLEFDADQFSYDGILYVNPDHIVAFNEDYGGQVNLALSDGINHMIFMPFIEFLQLVNNG